jgi:tetratricopeptide (TPR) repeat protein
MSSCPLLILIALSSFWATPGRGVQTGNSDSVATLLVKDEFKQAEALLDTLPKTAENIAWRGEIEYRRGDFDKAETLYREALRTSEKTARAHFGLGKLALAKLKGKEAVGLFKRAIELAPEVPLFHFYAGEAYGVDKNYPDQRKQLEEYVKLNPADDPDRLAAAKSALEMFDAIGTGDLETVEAPENPKPIAFHKTLNLIFTKIMINGQGPYDFAIDTGASQIVLSEKLAGQLHLAPVTTTIMHGVGGSGRLESKLYKLNELALGDVKVKNVPVGTFDDPLVTQIADGIIGTAVLSDFIVTVNYPENRLELAKKAATTAADVLPAWYFNNLLVVPLVVNGQFRGNFVVDTGAVTTVLSHSMAAKLGVTEDTPGAKVDLGMVGVGGLQSSVLRVPNVTFKTPKNSDTFPQVVSIDMKDISKMLGTEVSGVIGYDFLETYKVTLDYYGAEIRLTK